MMDDVHGYAPRSVGVDLSLIGGVAVLLGAIHVIAPAGTRAAFAFNHDTLDPVSVYTSVFVHLDGEHLLGNVSGFVASALVAYGLCLQAGRRDWFRATFLSFLVVLPALVSLTSYVILNWLYPVVDPITQGFSGVGAAFAGFVLAALLVALRAEYGRRTAQYLGIGIWLWLLLELTIIYAGQFMLTASALTAAGWGLCLWGLLDEYGWNSPIVPRATNNRIAFGLVVALLTIFVFVLFPSEIVVNGTVTNVFAHAVGFWYGLVGSALTHLALRSRRASTQVRS
jgi:membrane associated rhomboid family serine protease